MKLEINNWVGNGNWGKLHLLSYRDNENYNMYCGRKFSKAHVAYYVEQYSSYIGHKPKCVDCVSVETMRELAE